MVPGAPGWFRSVCHRLAVVGVVALGACATGGGRDPAAIVAVLEGQRDAWNRGDIEAFMAAYVHDDALVFTSGGAIRRGWDETLRRYRTRYADAGAMGQLTFWDLETTLVGSDAAVVLGRWRLEQTPEAGQGVFSLVFVRRDGRWQILHDHTSALAAEASPAPPTPPPS